ncbi:hypothetical protein FACS1894110_17880 [Spirochaetia bacterium]|nr:hypothetical protein FACS1894110_17880 [Spirochaetia bacterium]
MARMTEEEAWALDDEVTRNPPNVVGKQGGFFTERTRLREGGDRMVILDQFSAGYIKSAAEAEHKTPAEIIGELVRKELQTAV